MNEQKITIKKFMFRHLGGNCKMFKDSKISHKEINFVFDSMFSHDQDDPNVVTVKDDFGQVINYSAQGSQVMCVDQVPACLPIRINEFGIESLKQYQLKRLNRQIIVANKQGRTGKTNTELVKRQMHHNHVKPKYKIKKRSYQYEEY